MAERMNLEPATCATSLTTTEEPARYARNSAKPRPHLVARPCRTGRRRGHEVPRSELEIEMDAEESVAAPSATAAMTKVQRPRARMKNLGVTPYVRRTIWSRRSWNRPTAASAHTTSTHGSCASASSSSARRWTTPLRTSSARSCSSSSPKSPTRTSTSTSTRRGEITALFAIYDTMKFIHADVSTFCFDRRRQPPLCCWLGDPWQALRVAHARVLLHQPFGGVEGQASDIELQAKEILRMRTCSPGCSPRTRPAGREGVEGHRPRLHHDRGRAVAYG